jgi:hypothetical protein
MRPKSFLISIHFLVNGGNNSAVNYFTLNRTVKGKKIKGRRPSEKCSFTKTEKKPFIKI